MFLNINFCTAVRLFYWAKLASSFGLEDVQNRIFYFTWADLG